MMRKVSCSGNRSDSVFPPAISRAIPIWIRRAAVVFSTHVMQHAERLCDRLLLLRKGRKRFEGTITEARAQLPAQLTAVAKGDLAEWLTVYAEDAVLEDPVGPSMFDPDGKGHRGHEGITAFWNLAIAPIAIGRSKPHGTSTPAATGIATRL